MLRAKPVVTRKEVIVTRPSGTTGSYVMVSRDMSMTEHDWQ